MADCLMIYAHIKIVKGSRNTLIINLQNESCWRYLNSDVFLKFIVNSDRKYVSELDKQMLNNLVDMGLGVVLPARLMECFPSMEQNWDYPGRFSNGVFEISNEQDIEYGISVLKETNLHNILLKISSELGIKEYQTLTTELPKLKVHNIQLVILEEGWLNDDVLDIILTWKVLSSIVVYASQKSKSYQINGKLLAFVGSAYSELWVVKGPDDMIFNIPFYQEAIGFNTYYNRKLFVSGQKIFSGNEDEGFNYFETVEEAFSLLSKKESYWFVKKDEIDICSECEYRYSCFDRRIPQNRGGNQYYHIRECNYNPYIGKWKGENEYHSITECGVISDERGLIMDDERISEINKEL